MNKKILVTGGAGYIGSHTILDLIENGFTPVVIDNLSNSKKESLSRVEEITGQKIGFHQFDLRDEKQLTKLFRTHAFHSVIHFAGLKSVGESTANPLTYFDNNIGSTLSLLKIMTQFDVKKIVFSSSATVYGKPDKLPLTEDARTVAMNPYGRTKLHIEEILHDVYSSDKNWRIGLLRYFNPIGAHESGKIGENPSGIPNNLVPFISKVALGKIEQLKIFGGDYPTKDGTGVRDYIHVMDLANGHTKALKRLCENEGTFTVNLGTGRGYSVLEIIDAFSEASGVKIPYIITDRREGDAAECYADTSKAKRLLKWSARYDLKAMCDDNWRWQKNNPTGYVDHES